MHDKVTGVLIEARRIISKPEDWTQGAYARDGNGESVDVVDWNATCFCSVGALHKACDLFHFTENVYREAVFRLGKEISSSRFPVKAVFHFNDSHTHEEVLAFFDKAIKQESSDA